MRQGVKKILSQKFYDKIKKLETRYPTRVAMLLPALHLAQEETSWLPPEVIEEIGECIGIHPAQVKGSRQLLHHVQLEARRQISR